MSHSLSKIARPSAGRLPILDVIQRAADLGFMAVGFSRPGIPLFFDRFRVWISEGKHGNMAWMERHMPLREDPSRLLEDCRTIISLAYPYSYLKPCTPEGLSVARYSEPEKRDYHDRLREKASVLAAGLCQAYPGTRTRVCVDSAPIMERSFAYQSGVGFIGKNNQLIVPGHGSYLFLTEILTTAPIPFSEPRPLENQCGACTRCVDACPTGALEAPFRLNAARCLSYRTIEQKGDLDRETGKKMGNCFLGCDVCQEVCPFNKGLGQAAVILPPTGHLFNMDEKMFKKKFGKTALARAGLGKIQGNIRAMDPH